MSLLRLLTAGKSLVGLGQPESRYELSRHPSLPKFGSKRNPFKAASRVQSEAKSLPAVPVAAPAAPQVCASAEGTVPVSKAGAGPRPIAKAPEQTAAGAGKGGFFSGLVSWLPRVKAKKDHRNAAARAFVQTELSLEKVRVVRNDLSDTDLEVVPAGGVKSGQVEVSAVEPASKTPPADLPRTDNNWSRANARLFKSAGT